MGSRKYISNEYQKVILMQIFPPDQRSIVIPLLPHHSFAAQILPVGVVMVVKMRRLADRCWLLYISHSLSALPLVMPVSRPYHFLPTPSLLPSALCCCLHDLQTGAIHHLQISSPHQLLSTVKFPQRVLSRCFQFYIWNSHSSSQLLPFSSIASPCLQFPLQGHIQNLSITTHPQPHSCIWLCQSPCPPKVRALLGGHFKATSHFAFSTNQ